MDHRGIAVVYPRAAADPIYSDRRCRANAAVRRPCAACQLTYLRTLDAAHHLCPHCAGDLTATRAHVAQTTDRVRAQIDALGLSEQIKA